MREMLANALWEGAIQRMVYPFLPNNFCSSNYFVRKYMRLTTPSTSYMQSSMILYLYVSENNSSPEMWKKEKLFRVT